MRSMHTDVSGAILLAALAAGLASCASLDADARGLEQASADAGSPRADDALESSVHGDDTIDGAERADGKLEGSSRGDDAPEVNDASATFGPRVAEPSAAGLELPPLARSPTAPTQFVVHVIDYDRLFAKQGFYFTTGVIGSQSYGDLDGESILFGPANVFLPAMDAGVGFNVGFGVRTFSDAFEVTYDQADHTGSFQGASLDSTEHLVNFDWKHFFLIDRRVQPYTLLGFNIPWLDIDDGAQKGAKIGDATLYGFGMNLGGGAAYYLTPQLSVSFQAVMRLIDYFDVSALGHSGSINGDLFSEGWKLMLGTAFTF